MKRRILLSLLMVGVIASLVSVGSFSAFNDSESASGVVTAGTVELDDNSVVTLPITLGPGCPGPIGQGDMCVMLLDQFSPPGPNNYKINYTGSLDAHVAISLDVVETEIGCFTVSGQAGSIATGQGGLV
jgi:predicted ribosomally synthesized peptide with SipW-like signal peptide